MSTKPRLPGSRVPVIDKDGFMTREWYQYFSHMPQSGEPNTIGDGGGAAVPATIEGALTVTVNGQQYGVPYFPLS